MYVVLCRFYITYCRWFNFVATWSSKLLGRAGQIKVLTMYIYFTMFALYISVSIKRLTRSESFHTTAGVVPSLPHIFTQEKKGPIVLAVILTTCFMKLLTLRAITQSTGRS